MYLTDTLIRWIMFLFNPFIAAIFALREYTRPITMNIFWAFCAYYGFTFSIGNESMGTDILQYLAEVRYLYNQEEFSSFNILTYFRESGEIDILRILLSFLISRFTDSQVVLTTIYAVIFGFFYSRNIWYILNSLEHKLTDLERLVLLTVILLIPIWFINGFRMWTAFHVFVYGLLPFILENNRQTLVFVFLSFLVHFSFILPIGIVVLYMILGNRVSLYFIVFVFSIFISEINIGSLNTVAEMFAPEALLERSANYRDENVIEARNLAFASSNINWYVIWYTRALRYVLYGLLGYIYMFGNLRIKIIPEWRRLLSLTFMFFIVGNLLSGIPSGGRFLNFGYYLGLLVLLFYLDQFKKDDRIRLVTLMASPAFLLFIIVAVRNGLYSTSLMTVIGNPLLAIFNLGDTASINDFIK